MRALKHVGRVKTTGRKVMVAYRTLPNDPYHCVVVATENLTDAQHDALIQLVESPAGQNAYEFAEVLARTQFPDGSLMLANLHVNGRLVRLETNQVLMTPTFQDTVSLDELNELIAKDRGCTINELALSDGKPDTTEAREIASISELKAPIQEEVVHVLSDEEIANKYRKDAEMLIKEAENLKSMAESLSPTVIEPAPKKARRSKAKE